MRRRIPAVPVALTLLLLAAQLAAVPALSDPVGGSAGSLGLNVPAPYLVLAPAFTLWDGISMLSMTRLKGLLTGLVILYVLWRMLRPIRLRLRGARPTRPLRAVIRELVVLVASFALLLVFLVSGALWHRPMLSLSGVPADQRVVDFHSHTNASHDVAGTLMEDFDVAANLGWHARAGFDEVFITDHNVASRQPPFGSRVPGAGRRSRKAEGG